MDEESDRNGQVSARKERTNITLLPPNKKKKKIPSFIDQYIFI